MKEIKVNAPAKVNLLLRVIARRPDGYHDLEMVMVPLGVSDEITIQRSSRAGVEFHLEGGSDAGMTGDKNLAVRAANALLKHANINNEGFVIRLKKQVPIAAGLGGGSSDAGAVLKALNILINLGLRPDELAEIGKKLGADVPFFCFEGPGFVEGIGDRVSPYKTFPEAHFLLVNPGFAVSTPWVYKEYDLQLTVKTTDARVRPQFQVFSDVSGSLHNDLESVTIKAFPLIQKIKDMLVSFGAAGSLMSGSGPTVFGVFEGRESCEIAREKISRENNSWRVFSTFALTPTT